jgi:hypothetical protein
MDRHQQGEHGRTAIEEQIARHMVGIVYGSGDHKWEGIGSGCLIHWRESFVILTADHVISDTHLEDLRFFFRPDETLRQADRKQLRAIRGAPTKSLQPFTELSLLSIVRRPDLGIAAIQVKPDVEQEHPVQFCSLIPAGERRQWIAL